MNALRFAAITLAILMLAIPIAAIFCPGPAYALAQNSIDEGAVKTVMALEHAWNQAEQRKDSRALDAILDDGLVYVDYDGTTMTKVQFLSHVQSDQYQPEQEITESMAGRLFGNTVVITGIYIAKGMEKGKPYLHRGRFVDTWAFKDGKWRCVASQATPILH
ncbi:MAG TPA: nuclear transport factor 2 family protein [Candidatus Binatia bacterium]|nr:nuclear transport factor 2 family protein [Candidatus Binatia bacterium]